MNRNVRYLFKNIGLLTVSQFGSKFLTFLLVPLYTNILTTEQYGTYDVFYTTVSLLIPILMLNMADAVLRFSLDNSQNKPQVFSIGVSTYGKGLLVFACLIGINYFANIIPVLNLYIPYLLLMFVATAAYEILVGYARGCDRVFDVAVAGIINSVVALGLNIYLLIFAGWGLDGYFCAYIGGILCATGYLVIRLKIWNSIRFAGLDKTLTRSMLAYSFPLMLTSVSWWVNSFSSRYVILGFCGVAANGIYSVAYKIPSILTAFQEVFNKAWVLSSVKSFDQDDKSEFFSKTYSIYNGVMTVVCAAVILLARPMAGVLFAKDFYAAWQYVPFLTTSVVFGAMSGYLGGVFAAVKNTKAHAISTIVGGVLNLAISFTLVPFVGPMGAAIASLVSYMAVWVVRLILVRKYIKLKLSLGRDFLAYGLLIGQALILLLVQNSTLTYILMSVIMLLIIGLFFKEIKGILTTIVNKVRKTGNH